MAKMINREAPLSGLSSLMAMKGRQGDTELIHMTKPEIAGLASLGKITINPDTGLPEAFSFKQFLPALAGIAATALTGGAAAPLAAEFVGSSFILPALAAGATSAVVNKGDLGAIAFDGLLAGAGGALAGADAFSGAAKGSVAGTTGMQAGAEGAGQLAAAQTAFPNAAFNQFSPEALSNFTTESLKAGTLSKDALNPTLSGQVAGLFTNNVNKPLGNILGATITPDKIAKAGLSNVPTASLLATGSPTSGAEVLESLKVDTPEIAARKAAESAYGTRAADAIRSQTAPEGLTTQDVLNSALGRTDPLRYFNAGRPSSTSAPSSLYGQQSSVIANPAEGPGPVGAYVSQAAGGGSLQRIYEGMGGDIETFRGLVEGGGVGSDGMSDDISFEVIDDGEEGPDGALLSKDEYVIDAHTVAALGNGSTDAGADVLDNFVASIRNKAYNKGEQPEELNGLRELASLLN